MNQDKSCINSVADVSSPPAEAHSAPPGCSPHQTSCPDSGARSNRGSSVACRRGACGTTCTAPLVYTATAGQQGSNRTASNLSAPTAKHVLTATFVALGLQDRSKMQSHVKNRMY